MTNRAPFAPLTFPAANQPSAGFVTRFERTLRTSPDDTLGAPFSLTLSGLVEAPFADCLASMGPTTQHIVVAIGGAHALISIPDAVLPLLIEFAYGGDGSEAAVLALRPSRLAARIGYRMGTMLVDVIASALPGAEIAVVRATDEPADAISMKAMALAAGFDVMAGDASLGAIGFCVALQTLAGIENTIGGGSAADDDWTARLGDVLGNARLNIRCVLARPTLSAGEVARLVPGAVIPIPNLNEVTLIAGGYRIATGVADARDGRAAITINRTEFH